MTLPRHDGHPLGEAVRIQGRDWPAGHRGPKPGDFAAFAAKGIGLDVPVVVQPWDDLGDALGRPGFYASEAQTADPLLNAPANDYGGGCIYFDGFVADEAVAAALGLMGVHKTDKTFAVFYAAADDTAAQRYLHQIRLVSRHGLAHTFRIRGEALDEIVDQPLTVEETVLRFLDLERGLWGRGYSSALSGTLGGDGDWAKETLGFGILVENGYQGIMRVWSRPWLVTK